MAEHLRFVTRSVDISISKDEAATLAHAVIGFLDMHDLIVVDRKDALIAASWAEDAVGALPADFLPEDREPMTSAVAAIREETDRRACCDTPECPYHRLANALRSLEGVPHVSFVQTR